MARWPIANFLTLAVIVLASLAAMASVAYRAHLGGFAAGLGLATALLPAGLIEMERNERSLWQAIRT